MIPMKRLVLIPLLALAVPLVSACETAPVTGRKQLVLLSDNQAANLGAESYQQIKSQQQVSNDAQLNEMVNRVGRRIAQASRQPGLNWEFTVFQDPSANAFALPGGKVGVNTGLFDVVENEAQLAAVMAHEVAHVIADHSNERISRQMLMQTGLTGAQVLTGPGSQQWIQMASQAATLGITLPFTRTQESEADTIGLDLMARAGYDPRAAVQVWQNFEAAGGERPPEFLSTHPSPGTRIERLQNQMPEALEIYRQNGGQV